MTTTFADYCASQDARNTIELNVRKWSLMLCDALLDNFKSRNNNSSSDYKFYIESGRKYHKLIMETGSGSRSVHAFVDRKTGEVYKSASWKAPAKGVRYDLRLISDREWLLENATGLVVICTLSDYENNLHFSWNHWHSHVQHLSNSKGSEDVRRL